MSNIVVKYKRKRSITVTLNDGYTHAVQNADISKWPTVGDHIRGYYEFNGKAWNSVPRPNSNVVFTKLALIVESPHKDEFDNLFNPLVPLNGLSGVKFSKNILEKLKNWFANNVNVNANTIVEINIINPVQYQTSLWHFLNGKIQYNLSNYPQNTYKKINAKLRDAVWYFLFEICNLKGDFVRRIKTYNPDYIVNCCTGKNTIKSFTNKINSRQNVKKPKACVRFVIFKTCQNRPYVEDKHPCKW